MVVPNAHETPAEKRTTRKRRRGKLLKAACAGLLGAGTGLSDAPAKAFEVDEATFAPGGDFADLLPGTPLPTGVTSIVGNAGNEFDHFRFADLVPGSQISIDVTELSSFGTVSLRGSDNGILEQGFDIGMFSATVPGDGLVSGSVIIEEGGGGYAIGIEANYVVPEPGSAGLAAMGAAALLGLGRRNREEE